jgi:beta-glucosidase-like glycosyl hydrolase
MLRRSLQLFSLALFIGIGCILLTWAASQPDELESDHELEKMQSEVHQQLIEAAKRRALAKKHREQALKLEYSAAEDKTTATILKRKAVYAQKEDVLEKDETATSKAAARVKKLKEKAAQLDANADKDVAQARDRLFGRALSHAANADTPSYIPHSIIYSRIYTDCNLILYPH